MQNYEALWVPTLLPSPPRGAFLPWGMGVPWRSLEAGGAAGDAHADAQDRGGGSDFLREWGQQELAAPGESFSSLWACPAWGDLPRLGGPALPGGTCPTWGDLPRLTCGRRLLCRPLWPQPVSAASLDKESGAATGGRRRLLFNSKSGGEDSSPLPITPPAAHRPDNKAQDRKREINANRGPTFCT